MSESIKTAAALGAAETIAKAGGDSGYHIKPVSTPDERPGHVFERALADQAFEHHATTLLSRIKLNTPAIASLLTRLFNPAKTQQALQEEEKITETVRAEKRKRSKALLDKDVKERFQAELARIAKERIKAKG